MSNLNRTLKFKRFFLLTFLFYFFLSSGIYAQQNKSDDLYLTPMGNLIQIDAQLSFVVVKNTIENCPLQIGDCILKLNNSEINNYYDFSNVIDNSDAYSKLDCLVKRGGKKVNLVVDIDTLKSINCNNLLSGFATLSYINTDTNSFGAVAHPLSIGSFRNVSIDNATISSTSNLFVQKSSKGNVGFINAQRENVLGSFTINSNFGIKGSVFNLESYKNLPRYRVCDLNEVKLGKAYVLVQSQYNNVEKYEIEVVNINNQSSPQMKTLKIRITDKRLLNRTGGIVQGMSGAPIVQGENIIGAVSHALENDPTYGYALYIKWMLEG